MTIENKPKFSKIKRTIVILLIGMVALMCISSNKSGELRIGYIILKENNLEDNTFLLDEVEWVTTEDKERMKELNLTVEDLPSGYYIYNPTAEEIKLTVNEKTIYEFIDWNGIYIGEKEDKRYTTTNKEEFVTNLKSYIGEKVQPLFWVEIKDGVIIKIKEQLIL